LQRTSALRMCQPKTLVADHITAPTYQGTNSLWP